MPPQIKFQNAVFLLQNPSYIPLKVELPFRLLKCFDWVKIKTFGNKSIYKVHGILQMCVLFLFPSLCFFLKGNAL